MSLTSKQDLGFFDAACPNPFQAITVGGEPLGLVVPQIRISRDAGLQAARSENNPDVMRAELHYEGAHMGQEPHQHVIIKSSCLHE